MKKSLVLLLLLAACGERPEAFTPMPVDVPVAVKCQAPTITPPPFLLAALLKGASLAEGMKACVQDDLLEHAYAEQLAAIVAACR